jgi:hypothetical protein
MKLYIFKLTFLLAIIMAGVVVQAQTTQGTDFYLSFGNNRAKSLTDANVDVDLQIRVVATKATQVTYKFTHGGTQEIRNIAAGGVDTFVLSPTQMALVYQSKPIAAAPGYVISDKSLYIHSTEPISIYALNQTVNWTDATNLFPVNVLGTEYYNVSYVSSNNSTPSSTGDLAVGANYDSYTIVATQADTNIYVDGSTTPKNATPLAKGDVLYVYMKDADMTGTHITSNYPIAFFSTGICSQVPFDYGASDLLYQQLPPVPRWGKKYFVPSSTQGIDRVRIVASQDDTNITHMGGTLITGSLTNLSKGQFVELETTLATGGCFIQADKPIIVCSYLLGSRYVGIGNMVGDPSLGWVPSVGQFVDAVTIAPFVSGSTNKILNAHYAQIVTETSNRDKTTMRVGAGATTPLSEGTWTTGANPDYSFYNLPLLSTSMSYTFANPDGLAVMGYGVGKDVSYYYLAASALRDLSAVFYVNDELYFDVDGKEYCGVSSLHIKSIVENKNPDQESLKWFIDGKEKKDVEDKLEWDWDVTSLDAGEHTIRMQVTDLKDEDHNYDTTIKLCERRFIIPVNPY